MVKVSFNYFLTFVFVKVEEIDTQNAPLLRLVRTEGKKGTYTDFL